MEAENLDGVMPTQESSVSPGAAQAEEPVKQSSDFLNAIPEEYRERGYVKELQGDTFEESMGRTFKQFDELQKKLGQRPAGIPSEEAGQEDWDKFYEALGRPEKAEDYEFKAPEYTEETEPLKEYIEGMHTEAFEKDVKALMHEVGLTKKQAEQLSGKYGQLVLNHNMELIKASQQAELDSVGDFKDVFTKVFKDEAGTVVDRVKPLLDAATPDEFKPWLKDKNIISDEALAVMSLAIDNVRKQYGAEDSASTKEARAPESTVDIRAANRELMATEAYQNPHHPQHEATVKKVRANYERIPGGVA